jgi:hypothetical protein
MFKYLKVISKSFSKRQSYQSIFDKWRNKEKYDSSKPVESKTTANDINKENLQYQTERGLFDKLDTNNKIPDKINYDKDILVDEGLFVEVTQELKEELNRQDISKHKGTNLGYLITRFGPGIGEKNIIIEEHTNKLDYNEELIPRLNVLTSAGFSDEQIKTLLHKE